METSKKANVSRFAKKATSFALSAMVLTSTFVGLNTINSYGNTVEAASIDYGLAKTSQEGVILHCWNWSYNNMKKYMKDIAAAGYTSIQTSPVQQPKDYYWQGVAYGAVGIPDGTGDSDHGNWWKSYQPVTFSICDNGHTWYGTKAEFKAMCDEAEKYGVKVIVDIVANHMGNIKGYKIGDEATVMGDISPQVGEFWNPDMMTDSSYWHISTSWTHSSDGRFDVTQGNMGMPDLNTGDSKVQQMVLDLLKECIDCGADGFRFDAAKHIETPADNPRFASDFWDVVLDGARAYYKNVNGYDGIYFYGEVLNRLDDTKAEAYYRSKMSLTDNSTSDNIRNSIKNKSASGGAQAGFNGYIAGQAKKAVLWAESHDTYMGGGSSYDATDADIKRTWAMVGSRKDATALFFARPYYSKYILKDDKTAARQTDDEILAKTDYTQMGDVGTLTWADPSVVAVNRFHNFFVGQSEKLGSSASIAYNVRGNSGIVISKLDGPGSISLKVGMKDGTYTDQVTGKKFTVSGGVLKGTVSSSDGIAVIYNPKKDYGNVNPEQPMKVSASPNSGTSFSADTLEVTLRAENAVSASYQTSEGVKGSFTNTKKITIGSATQGGNSITVTITAKNKEGSTKTSTYTYNKKAPRTGYPVLNKPGVVFDNEGYGWSEVYVYVYNDKQGNNAKWPGVKMKEVDGNFWTYEFGSKFTGTVNVIFNNGGNTQIPGANQPGLIMKATDKKLFVDDKLKDIPQNTALVNSSTISATTVNAGSTITLTAKATGGTAPYKYYYYYKAPNTANWIALSASTSATVRATKPTTAGTFQYMVKIADKTGKSQSKTFSVKVNPATLVNNSTISATTVNVGSTITLTAKATGGTAPYKYYYYYKAPSSANWTALSASTSATVRATKPTTAGTFQYMVKVVDKTGKSQSKTFGVKVNAAPLVNNSTISATTVNVGSTITITAKSTGGTAPYRYYYYYKAPSSSRWLALSASTYAKTRATKPMYAGRYQYSVKIVDANGKFQTKIFTVNVH